MTAFNRGRFLAHAAPIAAVVDNQMTAASWPLYLPFGRDFLYLQREVRSLSAARRLHGGNGS
jgi:hypothetical protein